MCFIVVMDVIDVLRLVTTLVIIFLLIYQLYKPTFVKSFVDNAQPTSIFQVDQDVETEIVNKYAFKLKWKQPTSKVVVWIVGGSFMFADKRAAIGTANYLRRKMTDSINADSIVVDYPVAFNVNLKTMIISLQQTLKEAVEPYDYVHYVAYSAGVYLLLNVLRLENESSLATRVGIPPVGLKSNSASLCNGFYDTKNISSRILQFLFNTYIAREYTNTKYFGIGVLDIPHTIYTNKNDFLVSQSAAYASINQKRSDVVYRYSTDDKISHGSLQYPYLEETDLMLNNTINYLKNV